VLVVEVARVFGPGLELQEPMEFSALGLGAERVDEAVVVVGW